MHIATEPIGTVKINQRQNSVQTPYPKMHTSPSAPTRDEESNVSRAHFLEDGCRYPIFDANPTMLQMSNTLAGLNKVQ